MFRKDKLMLFLMIIILILINSSCKKGQNNDQNLINKEETRIGSEETDTNVTTLTPTSTFIPTQLDFKDNSQIVIAEINRIYTINEDGSNKTTLLDGISISSPPIWSPDGYKIGFISWGNTVYVMDADGKNLTAIYFAKERANVFTETSVLSWSPDGKKITFLWGDYDEESFYWIDSDGKNLVQKNLDSIVKGAPVWSPDGQFLAYVTEDFNSANEDQVFIIDAAGNNMFDGPISYFEQVARYPAFDPIGQKLAYVGFEKGVWNIYVDGEGVLTNRKFNDIYKPVWSPDGQKIAFGVRVKTGDEWHRDIFVINSDGSNIIQLTQDFNFGFTAKLSDPVWSPDGRKIAFSVDDKSEPYIYIMSLDGSNLTKIELSSGPYFLGFDW